MPIYCGLSDETDEILMERVRSDDQHAFAELYDRHADRAYRVARSVCRDLNRAEDAVQEGFLAAWRGRETFRPELGSFRPWLMRLVQNRAIDSYRLAARPGDGVVEMHENDTRDPSPSLPDVAIARRDREMLHASLRKLPTEQAEVIVLAFYGGLSHSEIAHQLDLPAGTVKGRIRLGLEKLRVRIDAAAPIVSSEVSA